MQTQQQTDQAVRTTRKKGTGWLIPVLLFLVTAAFWMRWVHGRQAQAEEEGDSEAVQTAMEAKVAHTAPVARLPMLLTAVQNPDPNVRLAALDPLVSTHSPQATEAVAAAFQDSASVVRERALELLPQLDKERGLRLLLAALGDEDRWIREAAITHLSSAPHHSFADKRALPTLLHALDDSSPVVQTLAVSTLRHLTGNDWRFASNAPPEVRQPVIAHWKNWWATAAKSANIPLEFNAIPPFAPTRLDPAPDFSLRDTAGKSIRLYEEHGKVVLVNFWGTWCPQCRLESPDLARLDAEYRGKGVEIIGVAQGESGGSEGLRKYCAEHGLLFRQALSTEDILRDYGHIHEVPVSVLIDAKGRICNRWEGERDYGTFRAAIEHALKN